MSEKIRVRFAPSPTGSLHIGGARTALFNWLFAKRYGGTCVLRIEDTDEVRSTPETVDQILHSLSWLGLAWDEGPVLGSDGTVNLAGEGPFAPYHQMAEERRAHYAKYAAQLLDGGKAYKCWCTKEDIEVRRVTNPELRGYDGRCRRLSDEERKKNEGRPFSIRFAMPFEGTTVVEDLIRGNVAFENNLLQDLVIQKTSGGPTYNFACVVDDHLMDITHVIRGDDHLSNTPSQIRLYSALGWEPPKFGHLSMIHGPDGKKLSKRHGAASAGEYRELGFLPETVRNYLALLGWSTSDSQQVFAEGELESKFSIEGCSKSPSRFDREKLEWMNGEYLRAKTPEEMLRLSRPFLDAAQIEASDEALLPLLAMEREKFHLLTDVPKRLDFFFKDVEYDEKSVNKVLKKEGVDAILEAAAPMLEALAEWTEAKLEEAIRGFATEKGWKMGQVFHPIRVATSGRTDGPTLFGMLEHLGKDRVLARIAEARRRFCREGQSA
ncbi:MAG: glutamate--tRNA ligase [Elusimicrobia bacterium CG1_02_63_36]|nr:MAG: glutamate--tRNA ligase [Elusimicrobia bacterium CG1_02_63_36]PIP84147.1 MAG: glutamate--tRNA ligase [Elusimicrobia bacterium CG22_combo_CG10-13_8_21_14_all_63_91]PJA16431.1 MAG: glutamate--tRNA ligase [Elusimicrobia bacterium CG_4_10_14_0_2_um_filter_63_34]PJB25693.1 MAG: glutamate--tRNA ligase [Elusimicrobia bacterium CG_4_9_14_3_um_filter_62_55]